MKKFFILKVKAKILIVFLSIGIIPGLLIGWFALDFAKKAIKTEVLKSNLIYAQQKARLVIKKVEDYKRVALPIIRGSLEVKTIFETQKLFKEMGYTNFSSMEVVSKANEKLAELSQLLSIDEIVITDLNGNITTSSKPEAVGMSLANKDFFSKAIKGEIIFSDFYYSDIFKKECITCSGPFFDNTGNLLGTVIIFTSAEVIRQQIQEGLELLGNTSDLYIFDNSGLLLVDRAKGQKGEALKKKVGTLGVEQLIKNGLLDNKNDYVYQGEYDNLSGDNVLGSLMVLSYGEKTIGMAVEVETKEAFGSLAKLAWNIGGLLLGVIIIILIISIPITKLFTETFKMFQKVASSLAAGNLTIEISENFLNMKDEVGDIARSFNKMIHNNRSLVQKINMSAETVVISTAQIARANEDFAHHTQEQAASIEEIAATIEEITSSVKQNADNSTEAVKLTRQTSNLAMDGDSVALDTINAMEAVSATSQKIANIINVVDEIAFQTNLLALNASVEAARAGDAGRGFAVVAGEVRNLAQRSATAAKEIKALIDDSLIKVSSSDKLVKKNAELLNKITENIQVVTDRVEEIAGSTQEQASGVEELNRAIYQVDRVIQQNASMVEEAASASKNMSREAMELKGFVMKFKINKTPNEINKMEILPVSEFNNYPVRVDKDQKKESADDDLFFDDLDGFEEF